VQKLVHFGSSDLLMNPLPVTYKRKCNAGDVASNINGIPMRVSIVQSAAPSSFDSLVCLAFRR
jgi:hypothetical protein